MSKDIIVVTGQFPARSETFVTEHIIGLANRGWNVSVVAREIGKNISSNEINKIDSLNVQRIYIDFIRTSNAKRKILNEIMKLILLFLRHPSLYNFFKKNKKWSRYEMLWSARAAKLINSKQPTIVHIHQGFLAAQLYNFNLNSKIITTWHGHDANVKPRVFGEDLYHSLFKKDAIHTVGSTFMFNRLINLGCPRAKIKNIPMGIDLNSFDYVDRSKKRIKNLDLISIGRLDEMKGHKYLINALSILKSRDILINLKIIGDGPLKKELKNQIKEKNLSVNINLLGSQNSEFIIKELAASDLFVLAGVVADSGRVETQGVAIIEAQASGLPVIVTDVGGVSESLLPSKTGQLVASRDATAIADAITNYINHKELLSKHGRAGHEFVKKNFSIQRMLQSFEEVYVNK